MDEAAGPSHAEVDVAEKSGGVKRAARPTSSQASLKALLGQQGRSCKSGEIPLPKEISRYLDQYTKLHGGRHGSSKNKENAYSKLSRIKTFIFYLAYGEAMLWDWCFLDNVDGIMSYADHLGEVGMQVTTASCYLQNIYHFVQYLKEAPPKGSRLTMGTTIVRAVKASLENLNKPVLLHRMKVKDTKMSQLLPKRSLRVCQAKAKARIPLILDEMEAVGCVPSLRYTFYGFFSVFVASVYGHRPGVLTNMTIDEVMDASEKRTDKDAGFVIAVRDHKTNRDFGPAQVFLHPDKFSWLERWMRLRKGPQAAE
ncbi:uncharacterized protein LOC142971548 [Anarhichas minor]|uniref:uncharacterized protein LOC142971548 n=1 Tax=Anarhichas minor TaxID=65739 RepID=UPI003F7383E1